MPQYKSPEEIRQSIPKLPRWAQNYIHKLEQDIEYWKEQIQPVMDSTSPIQAKLSYTDPVYYLPETAELRFTLEGGYVDVFFSLGRIQVTAHSNFPHYTVFQPTGNAQLGIWFPERN